MKVAVTPQAAAIGAAVLVGGFLLYKAAQAVPAVAGAVADTVAGAVSGNNAITQNQTNATGDPTTAYEGAGIAGTVGAAANSASGGWFATVGENVGGWIFETTHADPNTGKWWWQ